MEFSECPLRVDSVERTKRGGRLKVTLEDGRVLRISQKAMAAAAIYEGCLLSPDELEKLSAHDGLSADEAAAQSLAARPMSVFEITKRLGEKGYTEDEIALAVKKLTELGFLDDREYAGLVAQDAELKKLSRRALLSDLHRRGIDRELALETAENYRPDTESITDLVIKKYGADYERTPRMRGKIQSWLLTRGFGYSDIRRALFEIEEGAYEDPDGE